MMQENVVLVGVKPVMSYVLTTMMQFEKAEEVIIKARGKAISRAVDVAEIVRRRFLTGVQVKEIKIGTEELQTKEGKPASVSTIEITLAK